LHVVDNDLHRYARRGLKQSSNEIPIVSSAPNLPDLRLIDANANRAREGLRTAEDYIRFAVGTHRHSTALKTIRAQITTLLQKHFSDQDLVASRNVATDPLRPDDNEGAQTAQNETPRAVAHRGLKRAQEALRVLEEYLKAPHPSTAAELSRARYRAYEIEQWLVCASDAARIIANAKLYVLLSDSLCRDGVLPTAQAVLRGGAKVLQQREKEKSGKALYAQARDLRKCCEEFGAVLICNDRTDVALTAQAAGVHLGQEDLAPTSVRFISGERLIIGRSTHSVQQAQQAVTVDRADYIAIGSMYDTSTKRERILAGVKLAEDVSALKLEVPVFAIGGITLERIPELKRAGVRQIAVSSAVISAADPESMTRKFVELLES
jgi:thiamine-phosphate pyrophosphorylase